MTGRTVLLLADAATHTGLGHWVRSAALADELARRGWPIRVVHRRDAAESAVLDAADRGWHVVRSDWTSSSLLTASSGDNEVVVVDSYRADARFVEDLRAEGRVTVVIDDLANRGPLAADVLINQNLGADGSRYQVPDDADLLLGPEFALLRPQFARHRSAGLKRIGTTVTPHNVLIMMGGSDAAGVLELVVNACLIALPHARIRAIKPPHTAASLASTTDSRLELAAPTPEIAAEMVASDIVISAGGTSVWELCATARPFGIVVVADNQIEATNLLEDAGAACVVGRHPLDMDRLVDQIRQFAADGRALARQARRAAMLVDGLGCTRAAERIVQAAARRGHPTPTDEVEK